MFKSKKKLKDTPDKLAKTISEKAADAQSASSRHFKKYFTKRTQRMDGVKRFTIGWLALAIGLCLTSSYAAWNLFGKSRTSTPESGGTYIEGMVGEINNLNPLFSNGNLDNASSKLIFNGLLRQDTNGKLTNDLAARWSVGKDSKTYTVTLREGVKWQDGEQFSAKDVVFTINTIKNQATRSSLYSSWQGISVKSVGKNNVEFKLPAPSAAFLQALTTPILPSHILEDIPVDNLRTTAFNNSPIGTGPFEFRILRTTKSGQQLELAANPEYYRGTPRLDKFILGAYSNEADLSSDLRSREITAAVDLGSSEADKLDSNNIRTVQYPIRNGVYAFFKTTSTPLNDITVRRSLALAISRQSILDIFNTRYQPLNSPILAEQIGFNANNNQTTNVKRANELLDKAGWKLKDGVRYKKGKQLEINLTTLNSDEYKVMAEEVQRQWAGIGVKIKPQVLNQEQLEQTALGAHDYGILLYGISIGADPDVFAYWHSSQAVPGGLNFSEWKSNAADLNLETGRSRLEPELRAARYSAFSKVWLDEAPAVALYQPRINYTYNQNAQGFKIFPLNNSSDRLTNVEEWTVNNRSVYNTP